ncbi:sialic acid synthase [Diaphorina citri]|uniref:Sialic acid synthase n=1 Tax=Diaphorina citri TaxID=121845 RepID=A0A3Q0JFL5_DIACI|nr:sialic acid synthase [Diaphorina citri]
MEENELVPRTMRLDNGVRLGDGQPCFIIAEIGQNHQGDVEIAKQMIIKAKECGADCVKFQKSCLSTKFTQSALDRPYLSPHAWANTYGQHKQHLEFSQEEYVMLQQCADQVDIMFTASAMDQVSFDFLLSANVPFIKIGSGDSNNIPLIKYAASKQKPLIISTGMLPSIEHVDNIYTTQYHSNLSILHCVSAYPTPYHDINLNVIHTLRSRYPDIPIGYSGHENGVHVCYAAVAMGAQIIEKHFTLDKSWKGSDHASSLTPPELKALVTGIRDIEQSLGSPTKRMQVSEAPCYAKLGKCIVSSCDIQAGTVLQEFHVCIKVAEPKGICGTRYASVMGRKVNRDIRRDESIQDIDLDPVES